MAQVLNETSTGLVWIPIYPRPLYEAFVVFFTPFGHTCGNVMHNFDRRGIPKGHALSPPGFRTLRHWPLRSPNSRVLLNILHEMHKLHVSLNELACVLLCCHYQLVLLHPHPLSWQPHACSFAARQQTTLRYVSGAIRPLGTAFVPNGMGA